MTPSSAEARIVNEIAMKNFPSRNSITKLCNFIDNRTTECIQSWYDQVCRSFNNAREHLAKHFSN